MAPPDLPDYLYSYISDFWVLSTCRAYTTAGPLPIPWDAIDTYARRNGHGQNVRLYEDFMFFIQALDNEWLRVQMEAIQAAKTKAEQQAKRK